MSAHAPAGRAIVLVAADEHQDDVIAGAVASLDATARRLVRCAVPEGVHIPTPGVVDVYAVWIVRVAAPEGALAEESPEAMMAWLHAATAGIEGHLVDSHVRWAAGGEGVVAEQRLAFIHRRVDLDAAAFAAAWAHHAGLVRPHQPAIAGYTQHVVLERWHSPAAFDGIAEFHYRTTPHGPLPRYATPEGEAVLAADIAGFLAPGGSRSVWVRDAPRTEDAP